MVFIRNNKDIIKKILFLFKPYVKNVVIIILCMILSAGVNMLIPLLSKEIVDKGLLGNNFNLLIKLIAINFLLVALDQGIGMLETKYRVYISTMMPYELAKKAFKHTLKLKIRYFNNTNFAEIMNNINMDVRNISKVSDRSLFFIVAQVFKIAGGLIGLFIIDWKLSILVLAIIPFKYIIVKLLAKKRLDLFSKYMEVNADYSSWYGDTISGVKEIKLLGIDRIKTGQFIKKQRKIVKLEIKMNIFDKLNELSETVLFEITTGLLYIIGGYFIFKNQITIGGLMAFITYCVYVIAPISAMLNIGYNLSNVIPSAKRFFKFLEMESEDVISTKKGIRISFKDIKYGINFENVSFSYDKKNKVLNNISFKIATGEKVAIIGSNGSGKTTLINLILRFFPPDGGRILLDGIDSYSISLRDYRQLFSVVSQDTYLFNTTLRENILPASKGKDLKVIKAVCESGMNDFIEDLPKKYETLAGNNGSNFSGGQRQKISLARAIAKDAKFLILDEATSNYDMESEMKMEDLIMNKFKDKTVIMVTHRPQVLKCVDKIILLGNGCIDDIGKHDELYSRNRRYRNLLNGYKDKKNAI
jgi:ATP-binding cassette subfamily B protein